MYLGNKEIVFLQLYYKKLKIVKLNTSKYLNIGKISNLITTDIQNIAFLAFTLHYLVLAPLLVIIYTVILYFYIKWIAFVSLGFILIVSFLQGKISLFGSKLKRRKLLLADERNKRINNSVSGIQSVKYNTWEGVILGIIDKIRLKEKIITFFFILIRSSGDGIVFLLPLFSSLISIVLYQKVFEEVLTLGEIFFIISIYNIIMHPLSTLFWGLDCFFNALVSIQRIDDIFKYPDEIENSVIKENDINLDIGEVIIENGEFAYDEKKWKEFHFKINNKKNTKIPDFKINSILKDFNFEIKKGEFISIIGKVGSGKSSILKSLVGLLFKKKGKIRKNGKLAYVSQNPFLINATIRENILFGKEMKKEFYNKVIKECQLLEDLKILPFGENTIIGERGINLSGGQKQRISLARNIYSESDIYLIDDSLSALDSHVGKKIFDKVFSKMLKGKTRIMVTHALQYLKNTDRIFFIDKGKIICKGEYKKLITENEKFQKFISEKKQKLEKLNESEFSLQNSVLSLKNQESLKSLKNDKSKKLEKRFTGSVNFKIYKKYLSQGGWTYFWFNMIFFIIAIAIRIFSDYWAGAWSKNIFSISNNQYINYYIIIAVVAIVIILLRGVFFGHYSSLISYGLFKKFFKRLLRQNMHFFDTTPIGQILNLTSKDTEYMDSRLNSTYYTFFAISLQFIGTFILISLTNILIIPLVIFLLIIFIFLIRYYLKTSIELRRIELIAFSPILSNLSEFFVGLSTFRCLNKNDYMEKNYNKNVNTVCTIMYHDRICSCFINLITQMMTGFLFSFATLFIILSKIYELKFVLNNDDLVAVSLNWVMIIPLRLSFFMFTLTDLIKGMNNIERIIKNIDTDQQERDYHKPLLPNKWPSLGELKAFKFNVRYRKNLPLVLNEISFFIKNKEKIGIVGRTGSGKSTLIKCITRILEIDNENVGFIEIDGVKINSIGLFELRKNISVIPQDSYLFQGNLRENIDPLNEFTNKEIIDVLKKTFIWESSLFLQQTETYDKKENKKNSKNFYKLPSKNQDSLLILDPNEKLNFKIESKGRNLSNGERQLICIARALIKKPKILLMDEATSNIDPNTDKKIQKLIKEEFKKSTILTIAHRLETIIDYDRVLVFDNGRIVERGTPRQLILQEGAFCGLIRERGKKFFRKMMEVLKIQKFS